MNTAGRVGLAGLAVVACTATIAGCAAGDEGGDGGGAESQKITVWSWDLNAEETADAFMAENPDVDVEVVNVGTGNDQYVALQNAISAGEGFPDVAFIENFALPQFALTGALADLGPLGADGLASTYAPGPWASSKVNDVVYSLPWASGPMVLFYNQAIFDRLDVAVPGTWEEYVTAAQQIQEADPSVYILNDVGNAGLAESLIWQAQGTPFSVEGETVAIDLVDDEGTQRYADVWQRLIDEDLLAPVADWTDDWTKMLNEDQIATLPAGSWMGSTLTQAVTEGAGKWRVAQLPEWEDGVATSAEHGGGGFTILEGSDHKDLAFEFAEFATAGGGVEILKERGLWPSSIDAANDEAFLREPSEYFGGQAVNEEYATASANVPDTFQFLPFQVYANGIYNDTVGQAYNHSVTVAEGFANWQDSLDTYGAQQGFTIQ
ncbi:extracellular solute-binding protein [Microbacterium aquimaris]|uniref:extracellular solute-binding protein n=1 Tax=Microbacterium aquimaris TaxID=459816 RepID=UPI002AD28E11|nr:extracellular solute-binding protein [Microbacterium aquimaris]MDZ8275241.1 extracellular solute-binding protein [Microbacterium aquimaris]